MEAVPPSSVGRTLDSRARNLRKNLEEVLRVEVPDQPPTKEHEQWQVTKDFKQACGNLQDIGQQGLALEGRIAKNKAVLDEQQEQLAKVQQKLTDT